jgi:hypothetical protein
MKPFNIRSRGIKIKSKTMYGTCFAKCWNACKFCLGQGQSAISIHFRCSDWSPRDDLEIIQQHDQTIKASITDLAPNFIDIILVVNNFCLVEIKSETNESRLKETTVTNQV